MRKKSFLLVTYGNYSHASSRIRAVNYIPLLKKEYDCSVTWIPRVSDGIRSGVYGRLRFFFLKRYYFLKLAYCLIFYKWDLVFVQRFFMNGLFLDILRKKKIKMIYDFDDAIYLPKSSQKGNYEKTITMINSADHVIVSSPSLLAFCKDQGVISNVDLITTPVDTRIIKPPDKREEKDTRERDLLTIGWIGSPWTTKYLLDVSDVFRKLSKVINIRLLALGTHGDFEIKGVRLDKIQWSVENEIHYLREMDIGIMPLSKDKWAEAKGGYKLFLYMAAGLPVLASSVGFNNQIVQHGVNGYLCNKQQDWYDYLKKLHEDATLRLRMGMAGRSEAEKKFSYKINSQKLYSVIDQLIL